MTQAAYLDSLRLSIDTTVQYQSGEPGPHTWNVSVATHDDVGRSTRVFWMDGWTFRLGVGRDLADDFDALSADTEVFVPLVEGDDFRQRLVDQLDLVPIGDRLVLINHVRLNPELRGRGGIGRYLTGLVIREMDAGAALVALHASPFELREGFEEGDVPDHVWEAGATALAPVWESLGFHRFDGHLFVLDPARITLDDAMIALHARIASWRPGHDE